MMNLDMGMSSLALRGLSLETAVEAVRSAGIKGFELVPHLYGGPASVMTALNKDLRKKLFDFRTLTVHTSGPVLPDGSAANIASSSTGRRQASAEIFLQHVDLALELGADRATFHMGSKEQNVTVEDMFEAHLDFAHEACERAKGSGLLLGYECFDAELVRRIAHPDFGILFDIGHAALRSQESIRTGIAALLAVTLPYVIQFHVHGVQVSENGERKDHLPFDVNNGIDYGEVIGTIRSANCTAPLITEIGIDMSHGPDGNIQYALDAFGALEKYWTVA